MNLGTTTTTNQILLGNTSSTLSVLENMANDISLLIVFGTILILLSIIDFVRRLVMPAKR